jgi:hypothetical protein
MGLRVEQPLDLPDPRSALPRRWPQWRVFADPSCDPPTLRLGKLRVERDQALWARLRAARDHRGRPSMPIRRIRREASGASRAAPRCIRARRRTRAAPGCNGQRRSPTAADTPGPMRRKCRIGERAPEREQADRKPDRLSGEGQLACFARVHADDRDLFSVWKHALVLRRIRPIEVASLHPISVIARAALRGAVGSIPAQRKTTPPSVVIVWPVSAAASGRAKKATVAATSSGTRARASAC